MASYPIKKGLIKMNAKAAFSKAFELQSKGLKCKLYKSAGLWFVKVSF